MTQALENPAVRVEIDGIVADSLAVPVDAEAFERVTAEHTLPLRYRCMMRFSPQRDILRLDPDE